MGYMRHHGIVVTGCGAEVMAANAEARRIFGRDVTEITPEAVNGYRSFFVAPDGSKEGWAESDAGDKRRSEFKSILRTLGLDWAEVQYGDDDYDNRVVAASGGVGGEPSVTPPPTIERGELTTMSVPDLHILKCWSPMDDDDKDRPEDYCEMWEASECPTPCASKCYLAPCEHGVEAGCKEPCANCPEPCSAHHGISPRTGELYRGCMGPDGEDEKSCPCEQFTPVPAPPLSVNEPR